MHTVCLDLYINAFAVPISAIPFYLDSLFQPPAWFCQYQPLYVQIVYQVEMYAATILALHRLIATVSPRLFACLTTTRAMFWMNAIPWMVAFVNNLLLAIGQTGYGLVNNSLGGACMYSLSKKGVNFAMAYTVIGIYIPTAVMGLSYGLFLLTTRIHNSGPQRSSRIRRRRLELSRTMLILFVWHCVSLQPVSIMVAVFPQIYRTNLELQLTFRFLANSCSAINPVFCWCSSKLFQDGTVAVSVAWQDACVARNRSERSGRSQHQERQLQAS
ncbi:hypothetical protein BV898_03059 [Hypsibius exemplaris]|uniref:G-protein coupled receptors family 1 profile domain-containing protein n=1 Tax=Hypsibius exemplaris TaxID=2072580 RepID=A0A1W0X666_HYPEX|nr:hypothetical protein BV898_03059 [Hypsibius exemplaris]